MRARLTLTLFVITAVAMVGLAAITYTSQRSALIDQVDASLWSMGQGVQAELWRENRPVGARAAWGPGEDADDVHRGPNLQPGTYGECRDAAGRAVGDSVGPLPVYGAPSTSIPRPQLPAVLRGERTFTSGAVGDDDLRYRVLVTPVRAGPGPGGPARSASWTADGEPVAYAVSAVPLADVDATLSRLLRTEAMVIGGALALLVALAWLIVRVGLRPLDRMATTAGEIAAGRLDQRVEETAPGTEVGRLGRALNGMLGRLERAFREREASEERLRQFLSDASHELRTPLASIRGYAELFRVGAVREEQDVRKAMGRIEDEAARMGTLVEELLVLARLDEEPERSVSPVDLSTLAEDAVEDARATAPDRAITADVSGEAVVLGDDGQLRQVLANLVRNALVHTPDGTPIEVAVRRAGTDVELHVRDHGPGLPTDDPQAIFGRFWRSEGGRTRGRGGAGLGLAIVAAVVEAHGGTVGARDADGGGACFVVRLPAAPDDDGADATGDAA
nr:HAMP domain-containing sensor histidine kinase [Patulibacter sp. SYSU D01012]